MILDRMNPDSAAEVIQKLIPEETDKTVEKDGLNLYEDYDGPGDDKIVFYKLI